MKSIRQHEENGYLFSTDKTLLQLDVVHKFLSSSYWAEGVPMEIIRTSIENSLCFGIYQGKTQVGFARVVTDLATFAYLADVFVIESHRGKSLSKILVRFILQQPGFDKLRRFILATRDAHSLYDKFGFKPLKVPERFLEIHRPDVYKTRSII